MDKGQWRVKKTDRGISTARFHKFRIGEGKVNSSWTPFDASPLVGAQAACCRQGGHFLSDGR